MACLGLLVLVSASLPHALAQAPCASYPADEILDAAGARRLTASPWRNVIDLSGYACVTPEGGGVFSQLPWEQAFITGMETLDPRLAAGLAAWRGRVLHLGALDLDDPARFRLPPEAARELAPWPGETLALWGIDGFDGAAAEALALWRGKSLDLSGPAGEGQELSVEAARGLSHGRADALLVRHWSLTSEAARALAAWPGKRLDVQTGPARPGVGAALAVWQGNALSLAVHGDLPPEAARGLAAWPGRKLGVAMRDGALGPEAAQALAAWQGEELIVIPFAMPSPKTLARLAGWKGGRFAARLQVWASEPGHGGLAGLAAWNPLARRAELEITSDKEIPAETLLGLVAWNPDAPTVTLRVAMQPALSVEAARALAGWRPRDNRHCILDCQVWGGPDALGVEAAQALCQWRAAPGHEGLTRLSFDFSKSRLWGTLPEAVRQVFLDWRDREPSMRTICTAEHPLCP